VKHWFQSETRATRALLDSHGTTRQTSFWGCCPFPIAAKENQIPSC